jgi:chemotaxis protein MotA
MLQSSMKVFRTGMQMFRWVFMPPNLDHDALIAEVVSWSNVARKEGLLALESRIPQMEDPSSRRACSCWWMASSPSGCGSP